MERGEIMKEEINEYSNRISELKTRADMFIEIKNQTHNIILKKRLDRIIKTNIELRKNHNKYIEFLKMQNPTFEEKDLLMTDTLNHMEILNNEYLEYMEAQVEVIKIIKSGNY